MFATGPRAAGFTIVCPEGVIFRSMMTYHAQFLLLVVAGWVNRQQQDVIDYLQEENRVLRTGLRGKRLKLWFVLSIKSECLERMIFFSEQSLRRAVAEFIHHYHGERNHQGLGNALLEAEECVGGPHRKVRCRKRLGGLLSYYHRAAA